MEHAKIIEGNDTHALVLPERIKKTLRNDIMNVSFGIIPGHRSDWCRTTVGVFSSIFLKGQGDNHTISDAFSAIIRPLAPVFLAI
jgi:hypothetical protein